jgi:hypothetical protein
VKALDIARGRSVRPKQGGKTYKIVDHRRHHYPKTERVWVLIHVRDNYGHGITLERTSEELCKNWEWADQ